MGSSKSCLPDDLAADFFPTSEIIKSDKMQEYHGLNITTNKIPPADSGGVPPNLLADSAHLHNDFCNIDSVASMNKVLTTKSLERQDADSAGRKASPCLLPFCLLCLFPIMIPQNGRDDEVNGSGGNDVETMQGEAVVLESHAEPTMPPNQPDQTVIGDQVAVADRNRVQRSSSIPGKIADLIKYCQISLSITLFVAVVVIDQSGKGTKFILWMLCSSSFLVSIIAGAIILILTKGELRGNKRLILIVVVVIAFASDTLGIGILIALRW